MTEYTKFDSLGTFIAHCLDGEANGTGAPRTDFVVTVNQEPVGIEAGQATIPVVTIAPRNFEYMAQRFTFGIDEATILMNDDVEKRRDFLLTQAKSEAAAAAPLAEQVVGTVTLGGAQ
jgi:hypothetical protein